MTIELDEEMEAQVRVDEGKEQACFLNLFRGAMIIHAGKREDELACTQGALLLYIVRGEKESEAYLTEVVTSVASLRSRGSFILVHRQRGAVWIWHGAKAKPYTRKAATVAVKQLTTTIPPEIGFRPGVELTVTVMEEGRDDKPFLTALGATTNLSDDDDEEEEEEEEEEKEEVKAELDDEEESGDEEDKSEKDKPIASPRHQYHSLRRDDRPYDFSVRLFEMSSVAGVFEAKEMLCPSRVLKCPCPFPFLQSDLYREDASQPGLFLVDAGYVVYLWQGWWPWELDDSQNITTGSGQQRFAVDRRCAMQTTLHYCLEKLDAKELPPAYLVFAGYEPLEFTNLFPFWVHNDEVRESNTEAYGDWGDNIAVEDVLLSITSMVYTLEELRQRPLPHHVDPLKLESYLCDDDFEEVFKMTKEDFDQLPFWKQRKLKLPTGLH
ncbi:PREDICTED: supervillin-like [Priapulus caudatus]|uniref:Supervillin-like n=1 Tax=Priapulus caudatus TaxID=37621 RepID=A0ABM1ERD5_PRICU|nr:PREDICTED: supervillin-like [Priapulus caudatus]